MKSAEKSKVSSTTSNEELAELERESNFTHIEVRQLQSVFESNADANRRVDRDAFARALTQLCTADNVRFSGACSAESTPYSERLFVLLDLNHDGMLDLREFVAGLALLCKGTLEDKLDLSFRLFDIDANGSVDRRELTSMFKHAWLAGYHALAAAHPADAHRSGDELDSFAQGIAEGFAEQAFAALDADGNDALSFAEFRQFALTDPSIKATLNGFTKEINVALL